LKDRIANGASGHDPIAPNPRHFLKTTFGFDDFLPHQKDVIEATLAGEDLLVVLPTGSGKSLCFQIPALIREGLTIVVSPLIALMKDQIDALHARGLPVECLHSSMSQPDIKRVLNDVRESRVKMVYIAPERLRDGFFMNAIAACGPEAILWVVDEAHCITEWGHDFRTDYLYIPDAVERLSRDSNWDSQMVMYTATATPAVRLDIARQMRRESTRVVCGDFDRPNLYLGCRRANTKVEKFKTLAELLRRPGPGIIYTATRRQCEDVDRFCQEQGKRSDYYHAGRSGAVRADVQERFLSNDIEVIAATNAFGMGVDKPDIRFIIHFAHPASIDSYYQEIGRGGRDGGRCDCVLLFSPYDRKVQEHFIFSSTPTAAEVAKCFDDVIRHRNSSDEIALSRQNYESRNIELFEMEKAGILDRRASMCGTASIYLSGNYEETLHACPPVQKRILSEMDAMLDLSRKGYAELVDMNELGRALLGEVDAFELEQMLLQMDAGGAIVYRPKDRSICYDVRAQSVTEAFRKKIRESSSGRRSLKLERLDMIAEYGSLRSCLREYLLAALGDESIGPQCGHCDNCI
jgi:ATP-dependent DNA helicase RecQ